VVADAWIDGHAVHHVPVGLEERKEPVIVLVASVRADRKAKDARAGVDVVAARDDQTHVVLVEHLLHRLGDFALAALGRGPSDARAVVA
jgi:hypothetical protein